MFFQLLIALLLGCFAGIFTGLIPGLHINLVAVIIMSTAASLLHIASPVAIAVFIIAMSITHTFIDTIPSIFLGAPNEDTALTVLPGHKLLLKGRGYEAVKLSATGSLFSLIAIAAIIPLLLKSVPFIYEHIKNYIGYILIFFSAIMIVTEKTKNKRFWAFFVFIVSGILGIIALTSPMKQPLLPLLSGLFGVSILLFSLSENTRIPEQQITEIEKVSNKNKAKAVSAAVFSGSLTALFPGLSSSHAAVIGTQIVGDIGVNAFLMLMGGINTVNFVFSLVTLYTIDKARNGTVVAISKLIEAIPLKYILIFIAAAVAAGGIATFLALQIAKSFSTFVNKINYRRLCMLIIIFIFMMSFYFSSWFGILVLIVGTAIGLLPHFFGFRKSACMGCLLVPTILFFIL